MLNCSYLGDTAKEACCLRGRMNWHRLALASLSTDKLPDVVLYEETKNWLFLVEAVTTHGPVSPKRHAEIESMLMNCPAERVYVTAFLDKGDFRKYAAECRVGNRGVDC